MHRRQVLASAAALLPAAAGCVASPGESADLGVAELPTATLSMEAVEDAAIAEKLTHSEMSDDERTLLDRVVEEGSVTVGWYQEPPLHTQLPLLHEGAVYRASRSVVERRPAIDYSVKIDIPQRTPDPASTVRFADLPAADRAVFEREGFASGEVVGVGTVLTYTPDEEAASVLVPDPEYDYISWESGETAEWVVDDSWETEQQRYRFAVERVAAASEYGAGIREEFAFAFGDLTDGERDIVESAVETEHGYTVEAEATPSPAFERLVDRFRRHEEVAVHDEPSPEVSGHYLVRHDGAVHWTRLRVYETADDTTDDGRGTGTVLDDAGGDGTDGSRADPGSATPSRTPTRTGG